MIGNPVRSGSPPGSKATSATHSPRNRAVEAALTGASLATAVDRVTAADVRAALSPIDDVRATAEYRRAAAVELVRRAVAGALA